MSVRYTDNTAFVDFGVQTASGLFLRFLLDEVDKASEPITPMKLGNLRRDTLKSVVGLHATIKWVKEYAAAQEAGTTRGHPIKKYTTPGTGAHYAETGVQRAVLGAEAIMSKARLI